MMTAVAWDVVEDRNDLPTASGQNMQRRASTAPTEGSVSRKARRSIYS